MVQVLLYSGAATSAHQLLHESLRLRHASGEQKGMIEGLEALALAEMAQRHFGRAVRGFGARIKWLVGTRRGTVLRQYSIYFAARFHG